MTESSGVGEANGMVVKIPKLERLMNLVSALLASREPLPFREIAGRVIGYDDAANEETLEKRFDRDKTDLRSLGIPVDYVAATSERSGGYVIDPNAAFLRSLEFTPAEALLLAIAGRVGTSATGGGALEEALKSALRKLAVDLPLPDAQPELSEITVLRARRGDPDSLENLGRLAEAVSTLKPVEMRYRSLGASEAVERRVDPYGIGLAWGAWYLVGYCHRREEPRVFKVARIDGKVRILASGTKPAYRIPPDFDVSEHIGREAWQLGDASPRRVRLRCEPGVEITFPDVAVTSEPGGSSILELEARRPEALVGWVLAHGGRVSVVEPADLRARVAEEAARLRARYADTPKDAATSSETETEDSAS